MNEKVVISLERYESMKSSLFSLKERLLSATSDLEKMNDKVLALQMFASLIYQMSDGFEAYANAFNRKASEYQIVLDKDNKTCKLEEI